MIHFSLGMTPQSTISLGRLRQLALPAVIDELAACGYCVNHADMANQPIDQDAVRYRLEPGPATLTTLTREGVLGSIEFRLDGNRFGVAGRRAENDPVIWMRLWTLGYRLSEAYQLVPVVSDPDIPPGETSSPATLVTNS